MHLHSYNLSGGAPKFSAEGGGGGGCFVLLKGRVLISHWLFWQFNIEFLKEEEEERLGFPLGKYCEIL